MIGSLFGGLQSMLNSGAYDGTWSPKSSRIMVGRDVGALTATTVNGDGIGRTVVAHGDDVTFKSRDIFALAKQAARQGMSVKGFRNVTDKSVYDDKSVAGSSVLAENGAYRVSFSGDSLHIRDKSKPLEDKDAVITIKITEDTRIAWNDDGSPQILQGAAARTRGVLAARGEGEILIRHSSVAVEAGSNSTVVNLNEKAGTFTGGTNVTFLGSYTGGTFSGTEGKVTYAGYFADVAFGDISGRAVFSGVFENADIALSQGQGEFSGYFTASSIMAGSEAGNRLGGLFMNGCSVQGGDGDDAFSGRFISSDVSGGGGDDTFGGGVSVSMQTKLYGRQLSDGMRLNREYQGIEADIIDSVVDAGEGNDTFNGVMWGGSLNLGDGDDTARGVFSKTTVNAGDGDDTLTASFADQTTFNTDAGKDMAVLETAVTSTVITGDGTNTVSLGKDRNPSGMFWETRDSFFNNERPMEDGELQNNTVSAEKGETTLTVRNGGSSRQLSTSSLGGQENEPASSEGDALSDSARQRDEETGQTINTRTGVNRRTTAALAAYVRVSGSEPESKGALAVTVSTADGNTHTFNGIEREDARNTAEEGGIFRVTRRYNGNGVYSWNETERLRDR